MRILLNYETIFLKKKMLQHISLLFLKKLDIFMKVKIMILQFWDIPKTWKIKKNYQRALKFLTKKMKKNFLDMISDFLLVTHKKKTIYYQKIKKKNQSQFLKEYLGFKLLIKFRDCIINGTIWKISIPLTCPVTSVV